MNIWILTSEFPPMFGGGISTYCWEAGLAWSSQGHNVKVVTRDISQVNETSQETLRENFDVVRLPIKAEHKIQSSLGYWHLMSWCFSNYVIESIKENGAPDIIEIQDYGAVGYFLLKSKLLGVQELQDVKIIVYSHTPVFELSAVNQEPSYAYPNYWLGQCEKFCLRAADAVLSPSEFLKSKISKFTNKEVDIIPYPYWGSFDKVDVAITPKYDFLYVGRLEYRKGVLQLLEGVARLWNSGHRMTLHMVGGDTIWAPKQTSMKDLILKKYSTFVDSGLLSFTDSVPMDELAKIMEMAAVVVVPSIYENFPYVCMQSMEMGKPILASKSGGQAEMLGENGACGEVFDWDIESDFEKKLLLMFNKSHDELESLGINSRNRIKQICSVDAFIQARIEHFESIKDIERVKNYPFDNNAKYLQPSYKEIEHESTKGLLSIVIPFYNLGGMLFDTIDSIVKSSYDHYEVIVVNDGSTDRESLSVLQQVPERYVSYNIKIINIENGGLANARNVGAHEALGEYLAFLDADDCVREDYYSKCIGILDSYENVSFVYSWVQYFEESEAVWVNFDTEFPYFLAGNMLAAFQVVRRSDFLNYGINDESMMFGMEDYEAWLRMASYGKLGVSIPETMSLYRVRNNSMARQFRKNTVLYMYEQMATKNKDIYKLYGDELFKLISANGPGYLWNNPTLNYPEVGYKEDVVESVSSEEVLGKLTMNQALKLQKIATSERGSKLISLFFKFKFDKLFR